MRQVIAICIAILLAPTTAFGAILIDDFTEGPQSASTTFASAPPTITVTDSSASGLAGVLGGQRDLILEVLSTGGNVGTSASAVATLSGGFLDITNGSTVVSRTTVVWDGAGTGGGAVGLGGVDLTSPGVDSIAVVVDSVDISPITVGWTVEDASGATGSLTGFLTQGAWFFPFADFTDPTVFGDVDKISMFVTGVAGHDARISFVGTTLSGGDNEIEIVVIPEPATLAIWSLMGLSAAGGLSIVRRRQALGGGRPQWSQENRQAIHDLIDRGRRNV